MQDGLVLKSKQETKKRKAAERDKRAAQEADIEKPDEPKKEGGGIGKFKVPGVGLLSGIFGFLKKAAVIALLFLLPKILNSQFAKDTVKFLEEKIPIVFESLKKLFIRIKDGFGPLINFAKDPSFKNFKELFNADTGIAAGFAVLTALFLPFGVGKILRSVLGLAIKGLIGGLGKLAGGLSLLTTNLLGGDDKDKDKDKKKKKPPKKTKGLKGFSKIAKILLENYRLKKS